MLVDKELNLFNILDKNLILIVWNGIWRTGGGFGL